RHYIHGKLNGYQTEFDADDKKMIETNYKDDKKDGLVTLWENERKTQEKNYKNGKQDGLTISWDKNGKKSRVSNWKEGKEDGLITVWLDDGNIIETFYKNGKEIEKDEDIAKAIKTGKVVQYYPNGGIRIEKNYTNGKLDGIITLWYENGNKKSELNYKNGKEDGLYTYWDEKGNKVGEINHKDEVIVNNTEHKSSEVMQEIKSRCQAQMGEHGAAIVKACVDQDLEALPVISTYLESHNSIITRCLNTMKEHGYAIVKACAEQDIKAENELRNY
ncbi:MAG: toxin-antitoxin system YwqK family antitoxin, partial [Bacteriovorax sp.]|nr:toxin-antitoxin system YwqK family antitoxin [Bacteriovorax sp.]